MCGVGVNFISARCSSVRRVSRQLSISVTNDPTMCGERLPCKYRCVCLVSDWEGFGILFVVSNSFASVWRRGFVMHANLVVTHVN